MKFEDSDYYEQIIALQKELADSDEPFQLVFKTKNEITGKSEVRKVEHLKIWQEKFREMEALTEKTVSYMWPTLLPNLERNNSELPFYFDYETALIKILKNYKDDKGVFSHYYIKSLENDIRRYVGAVNDYRNNLNRAIKLSVRNQRKINKCSKTIKLYNKNNPSEEPLTLYDEKAKILYREAGIFRNDVEMEKILMLNRDSYRKINQNEYSDDETGDGSNNYKEYLDNHEETRKNYSKNYGITAMAIKDTLPDFLDFVDKYYMKIINRKEQNKEDQDKKECFLKKVITFHYYSKFRNLCNQMELPEEQLIKAFNGKNFTDKEILSIFAANNDKINEYLQQKDKNPNVLKNLVEGPPEIRDGIFLTMKYISESSGRHYNYGYKVIRNFTDYLKEHSEDKDENEYIKKLI